MGVTPYALSQGFDVNLFGHLPKCRVVVGSVIRHEVADTVTDLELAHESEQLLGDRCAAMRAVHRPKAKKHSLDTQLLIEIMCSDTEHVELVVSQPSIEADRN
jgi:hypothetical protein